MGASLLSRSVASWWGRGFSVGGVAYSGSVVLGVVARVDGVDGSESPVSIVGNCFVQPI